MVVGDYVFGPDGQPTMVVALSPRWTDAPCYKVVFDGEVEFVCSRDHLWRVNKRSKRRIPGTNKRYKYDSLVLTTEELHKHNHAPDNRYSVETNKPIQYPEHGIELPLDPYIMGCWLGDGSSTSAQFTFSLDDVGHFTRIFMDAGFHVTEEVDRGTCVGIRLDHRDNCDKDCTFIQTIRDAGLFDNKQIQSVYMRAPVEMRRALLQGLMDTDGHCNTRGTATFVNTNYRLANGVFELANSLGLKAHIRLHESVYNGEPYPYFQVSFQAYKEDAPFRLARKLERCKEGNKMDSRQILSVESVEAVPVSCIQVARSDGMYLVGSELIPTHNSTIITFALTIQDILRDPEITVGIFSHTRPVAKTFLRQIKIELETNELLKRLYDDVLYLQPTKESPKWSEDEGIVVKRSGNPKEATVEGWGLVDGQPTGRHFRLRVYDDVVTRESVTTAEQITKTTLAWELSDNLGVMEGSARYIGTRYNINDTYSEMIKRGAVIPRLYPATHNGKMDGRPVFFSEKEWDRRKRTQSRATVAAQLLQNPMADEDATFRIHWLKSYALRPRTLNVYIMCDPSRGRSATSDNTAISVIGIASSGAKFLIDGCCHRMTLSQRWFHLRRLYLKWSRTRGVQHIAVGYERYGAQSDDEYFQEQMLLESKKRIDDRDKAIFQIAELNWTRDGTESKRDRVERLEPDFRNGRFFLPLPVLREGRPCVWRADTDPDSKTYDDIVYSEVKGFTREQVLAINAGSADLLPQAIKCKDQEGRSYDLTTHFMEEYASFPFGQWKDLIDATSRIYDMSPSPPVVANAALTEPVQHWDR